MSGNIDLRQLEDNIERAKAHAVSQGVKAQNVDSVAAVLTLIDWTASQGEGSVLPVAPAQRTNSRFEETFPEWAATFDLQSHVDRFVAIAAHLLDKQERGSVNTDVAIEMYKEARWKLPQNPADVFSKAAARLFFSPTMEVEQGSSLKHWKLTKTGYQHLKTLKKEM